MHVCWGVPKGHWLPEAALNRLLLATESGFKELEPSPVQEQKAQLTDELVSSALFLYTQSLQPYFTSYRLSAPLS